MCRLSIYKGKAILLGDFIVKPENSLISQSRDAAYHPGVIDKTHERNIRVNGDGFGMAFYGNEATSGSCVFKFVTPAWSNKNLLNLGEFIYSNLIMAHVRAASSGIDRLEQVFISTENCHPFKFGRWTFMHNGSVPHFSKVKLALLNVLAEECFNSIIGNTDSEHIFALFLTLLPTRDSSTQTSVEDFADTVEKTILKLQELCTKCGMHEPCSLNMVFSDGVHIIATRFRSGPESPPSLYYSYGSEYCAKTGTFLNMDPGVASEIMISSAPLSKVAFCSYSESQEGEWTLMPDNFMLVCVGDLADRARVSKITLLRIRSPEEVEGLGLTIYKAIRAFLGKASTHTLVDKDGVVNASHDFDISDESRDDEGGDTQLSDCDSTPLSVQYASFVPIVTATAEGKANGASVLSSTSPNLRSLQSSPLPDVRSRRTSSVCSVPLSDVFAPPASTSSGGALSVPSPRMAHSVCSCAACRRVPYGDWRGSSPSPARELANSACSRSILSSSTSSHALSESQGPGSPSTSPLPTSLSAGPLSEMATTLYGRSPATVTCNNCFLCYFNKRIKKLVSEAQTMKQASEVAFVLLSIVIPMAIGAAGMFVMLERKQ